MWRRGSGRFSHYELAIVVIVAALFALPMLAVLTRYQGIAERQRVENDVRDMQTFLNLKLLDFALSGDKTGIAQLAGSNPIRLLERVPVGYLGEAEDATKIDDEGWIFDRSRHELVYRPMSFSFPYRENESHELRWQLERNLGSERSVRLTRKLAIPH